MFFKHYFSSLPLAWVEHIWFSFELSKEYDRVPKYKITSYFSDLIYKNAHLEAVPHSLWAVPKRSVLLWAASFGNMVTFESQEISPGSRIRFAIKWL